MKKNTVRWWIVLAVVLVVYNVIVFAVPFERLEIFFLSWIFTLIAIVAQVYVIRTAFYRGGGAKSKFYGFPIARIGATYLITQITLGLLFMGLGNKVKLWIPLVLYVVLLGISVVGFIASDAMRDEAERQDIKLKEDVACMRTLQSKAASIVQSTQDARVHKVLEKFSDDIRFSDPVSSEGLRDIEDDLTACIDELQQAVIDGDNEAVVLLVKKAEAVLVERNRLCKLEKRSTH